MVLKFIRWFRGYVDFSLYGKFPERFINLCSRNGINIWDTNPTSEGLQSRISVYDYKHIRRYAAKSKCRLKINRKKGMPFFVKKYKGRAGLAIGGVLFVLIIFFLSSFIWSVNIIGAENLSQQQIIKTLEKNGLNIGTYKGTMNIQQIQRDMIIDIPEIGWMSINVQDSCANVEIKEKALVPQMNDNTTPCNIKAKCDGVITDFAVTGGSAEILRGSAVTEGQLLVNSVVEDKMGGVQFTHADAKVYADVEQTKSFSMNMENYLLMPTGNKTKRYTLSLFTFEVPLTFADSDYGYSLKQPKSFMVKSDRNTLPLGVNEETELEYSYQEIALSKEQVRSALLKKMALYEAFCKSKSTVVERGFSGGVSQGRYTINVHYVFNEDIAVSQELYISE